MLDALRYCAVSYGPGTLYWFVAIYSGVNSPGIVSGIV